MPVDLTGTTPGLSQEKSEEETINLKCRNPKCDSITATIQLDNKHQRIYRCIQCGHTSYVNVGGFIDL